MGALLFFSRGGGVERDIEFTELLSLNGWAGAFAGRVVPMPIIPGAQTERRGDAGPVEVAPVGAASPAAPFPARRLG